MHRNQTLVTQLAGNQFKNGHSYTNTHRHTNTQCCYDTLWFFISFCWPLSGVSSKDPHTISHNLEMLKLEGNWITSELTQPQWPAALCALWCFRASNPDPSSSPRSLPCLVCARISIRSCQITSNTPERWWTISSGFLNAQIGRKRPVCRVTHRKVITRSYIVFHINTCSLTHTYTSS